MGLQRAKSFAFNELIDEIDHCGYGTLHAETARAEQRRHCLFAFLRDDKLVWHEDRREKTEGTGAWVRELRRQSDLRVLPGKSARKPRR